MRASVVKAVMGLSLLFGNGVRIGDGCVYDEYCDATDHGMQEQGHTYPCGGYGEGAGDSSCAGRGSGEEGERSTGP